MIIMKMMGVFIWFLVFNNGLLLEFWNIKISGSSHLDKITLPHSYNKFYHVLRNTNPNNGHDNYVSFYVGIVENGKNLTSFNCYIENITFATSTTFLSIGI